MFQRCLPEFSQGFSSNSFRNISIFPPGFSLGTSPGISSWVLSGFFSLKSLKKSKCYPSVSSLISPGFLLAIPTGNSSGISLGIASEIFSGIYLEFPHEIHSGSPSGILAAISAAISSGIPSGICPEVLAGIFPLFIQGFLH